MLYSQPTEQQHLSLTFMLNNIHYIPASFQVTYWLNYEYSWEFLAEARLLTQGLKFQVQLQLQDYLSKHAECRVLASIQSSNWIQCAHDAMMQ